MERVLRKEFSKKFKNEALGTNSDYYYIVNEIVGIKVNQKTGKADDFASHSTLAGITLMNKLKVELLESTVKYDGLMLRADIEFVSRALRKALRRGELLMCIIWGTIMIATMALIMILDK